MLQEENSSCKFGALQVIKVVRARSIQREASERLRESLVTGVGMSQLKKQNGCFLIRFRWCSVDGRKRYKNASVDEKLFIRFQETENGGFRKRISVDRAKFAEPPFSPVHTKTLNLRFQKPPL